MTAPALPPGGGNRNGGGGVQIPAESSKVPPVCLLGFAESECLAVSRRRPGPVGTALGCAAFTREAKGKQMHVATEDPAEEQEVDPLACLQVSLIVPALNEERNIGWVLERVPALVDEVILVDGRSTDDTIAVAQRVRPDIRV